MKSRKEIEAKRAELRKKRAECYKDADKAARQKTKAGRLLAEFNQDIAIGLTKQIDILNWCLK